MERFNDITDQKRGAPQPQGETPKRGSMDLFELVLRKLAEAEARRADARNQNAASADQAIGTSD